jgi:diguanylate cyclase (GGDEF)-like protein
LAQPPQVLAIRFRTISGNGDNTRGICSRTAPLTVDVPQVKRTRLIAVLLVVGILTIGAAASGLLARSRRDQVLDQERRDFGRSSITVAAAIGTEVRRVTDLLASTGSFVISSDAISEDDFQRWSDQAGRGRQEALLGLGYNDLVPYAQLAAYEAENGFRVSPPGVRPFYCLNGTSDTQLRDLIGMVQRGVDSCTGMQDQMAEIIRSGEASVAAAGKSLGVTMEGNATLEDRMGAVSGSAFFLGRPFYRGNPSTPEQRLDAVLGTVYAYVDGPTLMRSALSEVGSASLGVDLRWKGAGVPTVVARMPRPEGPVFRATNTFHEDGTWALTVWGSAARAHDSADAQARTVFGLGMLVTLLLAGLFVAILGSRDRAWRLVQRKTGELRYQALHDGLTGLPNRVLALDRAEQLLVRSRRERSVPAALFLDLDDFKAVNDSFGHGAGDELLQSVASRLRTTVRESETVARLGGDEFVVLADGTGMAAELLAQRIIDVMAEPFHLTELGTTPLTVAFSVGVATGDRAEAGELLRDADIALYRAKATGKGGFALFEPEMQTAVQDRLQLELDLHATTDGSQLRLEYQPTFDLETRRVVGVEALVRWDHPTRGVVVPNDFLPVAEDTGLIIPIGRWVVSEACRQGALWHAAGYPVTVSVNLSPRQLDDDRLAEDVQDALVKSGFSPRHLLLEVTESTIIDDAVMAAHRLGQLKALGVRVAIDDFGTGYSSFAYLQQFPVDTLKIDGSFIAAMATSPGSTALVHTLVQLGKNLGLETIAEGIEQTSQLQQLRGENCDGGQGFLLARPLESSSATAFFAEHGVNRPLEAGTPT